MDGSNFQAEDLYRERPLECVGVHVAKGRLTLSEFDCHVFTIMNTNTTSQRNPMVVDPPDAPVPVATFPVPRDRSRGLSHRDGCCRPPLCGDSGDSGEGILATILTTQHLCGA